MTTKFDIVKRLRAVASAQDAGSPGLLSDAATEIEHLRGEVERFSKLYGAECGRAADLQRRLCTALPQPSGKEAG